MNPMKRSVRLALLGCLSGIYFLSFFQRVAVPGTLFNPLQAGFGLTASGVAALGTNMLQRVLFGYNKRR